ncbi:dual specificity protein kinase TTK-like isoform X2 [Patiria miniata]|uniref:Protein kinase domain-containing protein n=1 Tax=Patiria miniata TaxID=46514 RepID=A0A914A644_PATMI|nr:dual specificity protein kinase TTK-like isoform X2 [Patiria miniata]
MDFTVQVQRIMEAGCRPEDWLGYLRRLETDPHFSDTTNRYRSLCSMYNSALKHIALDKNKTNPAYAQICINFAKLKMTHDPDDARMFFKYARANIKTLAIVHVEAAQFELDQGNRDKCLDILKKAKNLKVEPQQMIATAVQRFNMAMTSLHSDENGDSRTTGDQGQWISAGSKPPVGPNSRVTATRSTSLENTKPQIAALQPLSKHLTPSHTNGPPCSQATNRQHNQAMLSAQSQPQAKPDTAAAHGETPVFQEYVDSTVSFGRSGGRKRQSSGASSSDDGDTIPWLFNKPWEVASRPVAPAGNVTSQSASKLKRGNIYTPDCKSLPVCYSVGEASRRKNRPIYGTAQRVKRSSLILQEVPPSNPDDSDDDFPFPDIKPLEKTVSPGEDKSDSRNERLTAIIESPQQTSNDSGVAMMTTPSTEQPRPPTLSRNYSNVDTLRLHTPSQHDGKPQASQQRMQSGLYQMQDKGISQDASSVSQETPNVPHSVKPEPPVSRPTYQPPLIENGASHQKPIHYYGNNQHYSQQMMAPMPVPQPVQRKDVITVNKVTYTILRIIGKGGSSKVYQVFSENKKKVLAIKYVKLDCADDMTVQGYINEITLLQKLRNSENIIHLYDFEITDSHIYLVMECGSIDLATFLSKHKKIDPQDMKFYWRGMLDAVDVVHQAGIVHSDLKPANFLFVEGTLKLIDFGIANAIQSDKTSVVRESQVGTLNYMSPEAIQDTSPSPQVDANGHRRPKLKINCKSDVWSLGCIFYYMVYGKTPFQHITLSLMKLQAICDPRHVIEFPAVDNPHLLDLLKKCLIRDPRERPSIPELRKHPYFLSEAAPVQEEASKPNLTEEHLKSLISQLSHAQINSPTSITAVTRTLMEQLQSGQQFDISTALGSKVRSRPFQQVAQQPPTQPPAPPPHQPSFDMPQQPPQLAQPRQANRVPLQVVQREALQQAQSALKPLCRSQSNKYMRQESHEKENRDLEAVLRGQLAHKYQNALPTQVTEEQTYEQTWGTETMK